MKPKESEDNTGAEANDVTKDLGSVGTSGTNEAVGLKSEKEQYDFPASLPQNIVDAKPSSDVQSESEADVKGLGKSSGTVKDDGSVTGNPADNENCNKEGHEGIDGVSNETHDDAVQMGAKDSSTTRPPQGNDKISGAVKNDVIETLADDDDSNKEEGNDGTHVVSNNGVNGDEAGKLKSDKQDDISDSLPQNNDTKPSDAQVKERGDSDPDEEDDSVAGSYIGSIISGTAPFLDAWNGLGKSLGVGVGQEETKASSQKQGHPEEVQKLATSLQLSQGDLRDDLEAPETQPEQEMTEKASLTEESSSDERAPAQHRVETCLQKQHPHKKKKEKENNCRKRLLGLIFVALLVLALILGVGFGMRKHQPSETTESSENKDIFSPTTIPPFVREEVIYSSQGSLRTASPSAAPSIGLVLSIGFYNDTAWKDLPTQIREAAIVLGYDKTSWNEGETVEIENMYWNQLSQEQQKAAILFGYDRHSWDGAEAWSNLTPSEEAAASDLGYNEHSWNLDITPKEINVCWDDLSSDQQAAAEVFGYDKVKWDGGEC